MYGSVQLEVAKWLVEILDPVRQFYPYCCVPDSSRFASMIRQRPRCVNTEYFISFDISSLFTNILLDETIRICADYLYRCHLRPPLFPENICIELMQLDWSLFSLIICVGNLNEYLWANPLVPLWPMYSWFFWNDCFSIGFLNHIIMFVTLMILLLVFFT